MKKTLIIILIIFIGFFIFGYWQSKKPCPSDDPLGLFTTCKTLSTDNPLDL